MRKGRMIMKRLANETDARRPADETKRLDRRMLETRASVRDARHRRRSEPPAAATHVIPRVYVSPEPVLDDGQAAFGKETKPEKEKGKGLLGDLTVSQVAAGALAAVTSMLMSAQIGIAGSVIGAAVGSVVSTVASQLYKRFLQSSAEHLKSAAAGGLSSAGVNAASSERVPGAHASNTAVAADTSGDTSFADAFVTSADDLLEDDEIRRISEERRTRASRLKAAAVGLVAALAAVALTAGTVSAITSGKGFGPTFNDIVAAFTSSSDAVEPPAGVADDGIGSAAAGAEDAASAGSTGADGSTTYNGASGSAGASGSYDGQSAAPGAGTGASDAGSGSQSGASGGNSGSGSFGSGQGADAAGTGSSGSDSSGETSGGGDASGGIGAGALSGGAGSGSAASGQ